MLYHNLELDIFLRGIVMTRGENGATIAEMRSDYYKLVGEQWPLRRSRTHQIIKYLKEIDGLMMEEHDNGLCIWYIDDIGSNVSHEHDSNNNVITIDSIMATVSEKSQPADHNNYAIPALRRRIIASSSFVNAQAGSSTSTATTVDTSLLNNESTGNENLKRHLSQVSQVNQSGIEKRPRTLPPNGLPLNEENLDIHNRENGINSMAKATSTEIEKSILIPNDLNNSSNDYIAPIKEPEDKRLQQAFANSCQIGQKHNFMQIDSIESTLNLDERLLPSSVGIIGDDFMRSLISFELYGSDFTKNEDEKFENCFSGQTVQQAYHLVLDKQHELQSKYRYLIVNVGAIDILLERDIVDIIAEYARFIRAILTIGLQPIITTIPYVRMNSNNRNYKPIYQTLLLFNQFLQTQFGDGYLVLNLHSCFTERRGFPSAYYYDQPKTITLLKGTAKLELYPWTEPARKKILNKIDTFLVRLPGI